MVKMKTLQDFIETVLWTGYIDDEKPVSLFIIAKPESGKTAVIKRYIENKGVLYFTDVTAWGISDSVLPLIEKGINVHHIIIPDFLNCVVKNRSTADKLVMFLNALTEEGITNIATYANRGIPKEATDKQKNAHINCGVITCITRNEYQKKKTRWQSLGFLSRFLPIQYSYSSECVDDILHKVAENVKELEENKDLGFPDGKQRVELPSEIAKKMIPFSKNIGTMIDAYGIRLQVIFDTLLKANALKGGRHTVEDKDFDDLMGYIEFIKYNNNNITTI